MARSRKALPAVRRGGVGRVGVRRVVLVALFALAAATLPAPQAPDRPASAGPGGPWNGSRAELFITNVVPPSIVPDGPPRALTANLVNHGPSNATNVRFTYRVPFGISFSSASLAGGSCSFSLATRTVTCTRGGLVTGASAAISISVSAPSGTSAGTKQGSFTSPTSDQFNPAGGNILMERRTENWVTGVEGNRLPPVWPPSDPYTGPPPPCADIVDSLFRLHDCQDSVVTFTVFTESFGSQCQGLFELCLRTWEMAGTYYAQESGQVRFCADDIDDGAYVNWSEGYDPAVTSRPFTFTSTAEVDNDQSPWVSNTWSVTAGQAYRFSIRVANRDTFALRGRGEGGIGPFGLSAVNGAAATCSYDNFFPPQPGNVTVESTATITLTKALGTARVRAGDEFTVQLKDSTGSVVNPTANSTTTGSGSTVTPGTGTTGPTRVTPGATYTLTEIAAGTTVLSEYDERIACTNATAGSPTTLPSGPIDLASPPTVTPAPADAIRCELTNSGQAPTVTILKGTDGGDASFDFTVVGGPLPVRPTITTVGGTGSAVLANTQIGQTVNITENPVPGWSLSTSLCTNRRTGAIVTLPYTLLPADQVVCSFANRALAASRVQPCVTNPVLNANFSSGSASWTATGSWTVSSGRMSNFADNATFATDRVSQTIGAVAPSSLLSFDIAVDDGAGGEGGNEATLQVFYGGIQYASIVTTPASAGLGGNATVTGLAGATVSPTTIPMGTVRNVAITLPTGVPRTGDLQYRFGVTGTGETGVGDNIGFTGVVLQTTAICLQKQSTNGFATFGFTTTNLDTNTATPPAGTAFSITTSEGNNPATVNPIFGRTGTQLVVLAPGSPVTLTETSPTGWTPSSVSCTDAFTGAAVSGVSLAGKTVTIAGTAIAPRTVLNCVVTDATLSFTVAKAASPATAAPGATVTYTVTVRNTGLTAYPGASFFDDLTGVLDDSAFGTATASTGTATFTAPRLTWSGDLPAGGSATVTYTVVVNNPDAGNHRLSNVLTTTSSGGNCTAQRRASDCVTDTPVADSRLLKTTDRTSAAPGGTVTYTVQIANTGDAPLAGASFADNLTGVLDDAAFGSASATIGTAVFSAPTLSWTGDLPVGATATVTYTVTVNRPDDGDHVLANVIASPTTGSNCATGSTNTNCRTSTPVAGLRIVKSADRTSATPGEAVAYTLTVTNIGQTTLTGTLFTDNVTDVLDDATVGAVAASTGSAQLTGSQVIYSATLAPGAVATVTYTATVRRPVPGNQLMVNAVSSAVPGGTCPAGTNGSICTLTVPLVGLHLQKSVDATETEIGGTVTYTTTLTNSGQVAASGVSFTDDLTGVVDDAVVGTPTASSGVVTFTSPTLTWTGDVAIGATVTLTYIATVNEPATGDHRLRNLIASSTPGTDCPGPGGAPRPGCATDTPIAELRITKTPSVSVVAPGERISYTVTVENVGQTAYPTISGVDDLSGVLDDADFVSASASGGVVEFNEPFLTWSSTLPAGASGSMTYVVQVRRPDTGDHHLVNRMASEASGSSCPEDPACRTDTPVADLQVAKSVDVSQAVPGQIVTYTVEVENAGAVALPDLFGVDDLSGVLDDATFLDATASGGTVEFESPLLTWTASEVPLPVGGTATVVYRFRVNDPDTGDRRLINSLSSTNLGVSCPGGPACVTDTPVAVLTIDKTVDAAVVNPGATAGYTVTVTNPGQVAFTGATFSDDLSDVVDDAAVGGIAATVGTASLAGDVLTWVGDLAPGASAVVTYQATVNVPDVGNRILANGVTSTTPGNSCATADRPGCSASAAVPGFEIRKSSDRPTADPGDTVTYTIDLVNLGQTTIVDAVVTDDLTGVLDDATFDQLTDPSIGVATFAAGPPPTVTWSGTLLAGESTSFTYTVTVNPSGGDHLMTNAISTLTAGSNCPPQSADARCAATTLVNGLSINKTTDRPTAIPGDTVSHSVTVTNTGQAPLTGASFTDDLSGVLDDATFGVLTQPTIGSATFNPGAAPTVTWSGDLGPGESTAVTYTVTVSRPGTGDHVMTDRVTSTTAGTDCPPGAVNPACAAVTRVTEMRIVKTSSAGNAVPGDTVGYTVVVSNVGASPISGARFADSLAGVLDDATYVSATATAGSVAFVAPTLTWTGNLAIGTSVTVTYTVRVSDPDPGDALLRNSLSSATPGADCSVCTTDTPISRLSIVKTVSQPAALPGDAMTFTVVVTNTGQVALTADFTDDLTGVLDDAVFGDLTSDAGTATFDSPLVTWSGSLAPAGGSATITYSVTVNDPASGDRRLINAITSTTPGDNCPCATDTPIGGVTIAKSTDRTSVGAGEPVTYTIVITNPGQVPLTGATFTDDITGVVDDAVVDAVTATSGTVSRTDSAITWSGDLAVGTFAVISYRATVAKPGSGNHRLTNTVVSATPSNNCMAGSVDPDCATDTPVAEIAIVKTASPSPAVPGADLTYTVTVTNVGQTVYTGAAFDDDLSGVLDDATFGTATADVGTATFASPTLTWTGDLPIGQTATVTVTVAVTSPATGDHLLRNAVTSSTTGTDCPGASTCSVEVPVADVQVGKTADRTTTVPGDTVTYTLTITNSGQSTLAGATVTDDLTGALDDATFGAASATIGSVAFAPPTLTWTGNLPAGTTATVTYSVIVREPDPGDHRLINRVVAPLPGSNCTTAASDPVQCTTTIAVAELRITKTAAPATTVPNGTVTYTAVVSNTGQTTQSGLLFVDDLTGVLDDANFGTVAATVGTASFASPQLSFTASLAPGGTSTVTYTVQVRQLNLGDQRLVNRLTSTAPGATCSPTGPCITDTPVGRFAIVTSVDLAQAVPGDSVTYTVALTNAGQTALLGATFTDDLTGVLDDATFDSATSTVGSVVFTSPDLVWTGDLGIGESATVTYTVTIREPDPGDHRLINTLTSPTPGSPCTAAEPCQTDTPVGELDIVKQVDRVTAAPGDVVTYTVSVVNSGQIRYTDATITDDLSGILDDASFAAVSATSGVAAFAFPRITWGGDLDIGESVTASYRVSVNQPGTGDHVLFNTLASPTAGASCSIDTPCTTSTPVNELSIVKTATPASAPVGGTVEYQLVVRNLGQVPYLQITVVDDLSGALDDATFTNAAATSGSAVFTAPTLTWTGDVPLDGTVTITYSMTVATDPSGDHVLTNSVTSPADGSTCTQTDPCRTSTPVGELQITKVASTTTVPAGGRVDYTVTVTNHGQTDLPGATFTDDLSGVIDDAVVGPPSSTVGSAVFTSPNLVWTGDLPIGAVATVTYSVTVASPSTGDHLLVNSVSSSTPGSSCPATSPCPTTTTVSALTISKTVDRTTANPGETVRYTIVVANTGQAPLPSVSVRDDLSGVLDDAVPGSAAATRGPAPAFVAGVLVWEGDLDVGASVAVTYTVIVNSPGTGDHRLRNAASSATAGSNCTVDQPCATDTPIHELRIVKTASESGGSIGIDLRAATPGQEVRFAIVVTNAGQVDEPAAVVTDDLTGVLDDATFIRATAASGTVTVTPLTLTWTGPIAINAEVTITYLVRVNDPVTGDRRLNNLVTTTSPLSNCPTALACRTAVPVVELSIVKTVDRTIAVSGDTVTFTVTVRNFGRTPLLGATFTDDLSGVLDDAEFGAVTSGNASFAAPSVTWTGDLPALSVPVVVTYTVVVDRPSTGDHLLTNAVSSTTTASTCTPDVPCVTETPVAEWTIVKAATAASSPAVPGDTVAYTVTLTNPGRETILDATFTDDLTAVLDDASVDPATVTATAGTVDLRSTSVVWTGDLPVGGSPVTVSYLATIDDPVTGDHLLTNGITSPVPNGVGTAAVSGVSGVCVVCTTTTPVAELTIDKRIDRSPAAAGELVTYSMTVTNAGRVPYQPATVTDNLAGVLDDATPAGATATVGATTFVDTRLVWSGDLPAGASATVTYQLQVSSPGTGDHRLINAASSADPGSGCPGAAACTTDTPVAELTLLKRADRAAAAVGDTVTYTVDVANTGRVDLPGASFTDDLTGVLDDAVPGPASATTGTATVSPPTLTWSGDLAAGASARVAYSVSIRDLSGGDGVLVNEVTSTTRGSSCPSRGSAPESGDGTQVAHVLAAGEGCSVTVTLASPPPAPSMPGPGAVTGLPLAKLVASAVLLLVLGSLALWWPRPRRAAGRHRS
jgi:large repetitive protein